MYCTYMYKYKSLVIGGHVLYYSCSTDHLEPDTTCTSASYSNNYYGSYGCPVSPPLSYADLQNGDLSGPLEDYDTFVAEKLLDISGDYLNPNAFFNRYQVCVYKMAAI